MKNLISILCFLALNIFITGCQEPKVNEKAVTVTFLVDVTDKPITTSIVDDFNANLNAFFTSTGLGKIDLGQSLTVRMGPIDESDQLSLQTRSIALTDKNVSRREAERQRNPRPILEMIKEVQDQFPSADLFIPMNHEIPNAFQLPNEIWAKKVLVDNYAILPSEKTISPSGLTTTTRLTVI